jgi:dTMP kinase
MSYIAIEGVDTAGKSTQIANLKEIYPEAIFTKEPGGTELGAKIRELVLFSDISNPATELLLFLADRAEHIQKVIKPNLDKLIISDRSVVSGMAYALVKKEFSKKRLAKLNKFATEKILPDCVIILELSPDELKFRLSQKEHDKIESRGIEYLLDIQKSLINACEILDLKYHVINASKNVEVITNEIKETIDEI